MMRPKPCRMDGGDSSGTPLNFSLSLGVVPDIAAAPATRIAFTRGPLGEEVWFAVFFPVDTKHHHVDDRDSNRQAL